MLFLVRKQGPHSQHFIFFVTNKRAQQVRVLYNTRLERLVKDQHSSLLNPFVVYKENKVLWIGPQVAIKVDNFRVFLFLLRLTFKDLLTHAIFAAKNAF